MTIVRVVMPTQTEDERVFAPDEMVVPDACAPDTHAVLLTPPEHADEARRQAHLLVTRCDLRVAVVECDLGPGALLAMAEEAEAWGRADDRSPGAVVAHLRSLTGCYLSFVWRRTALGLDRPAVPAGHLLASFWPGPGFLFDLRDWSVRRLSVDGPPPELGEARDVRVASARPLPPKVAELLGLVDVDQAAREPLTAARFGRSAGEITARLAQDPEPSRTVGSCPSCQTEAVEPSCPFCHNTTAQHRRTRSDGERMATHP